MASSLIKVLYEEGPCLAVWKPPGISTQSPPGIESLEARIKQFLREREQKPGNVYLGVPHRMDRPVSGVLVFAKHVRAARRLSKQFERREVQKIYWACVAGEVMPPSGTWTDTMRKVPYEPRAEIVEATVEGARTAVLHYRALRQTALGSLLEVTLETGRMHQIRLQAATHGHPVLGDVQYGSSISFGTQHSDERSRTIALHGRSLSFQHPMTRTPVTVIAPLPRDWLELNLSLEPADYIDEQ